MSLFRPILRTITVAALRNRTWAAQRVLDSDKTPLADMLTANPAPYIVVYTDDDGRSEIDGLSVYNPNRRRVSLIIEMGMASVLAPAPLDPNQPQTATVQFAATDQGNEWAVDGTDTQVLNALLADPRSIWGGLFHDMVRKIDNVVSRRGGKAESGLRWAARQLILVCDPACNDLPSGVPYGPNHVYRRFLQAITDNGAAVGISDLSQVITNLLDMPEFPDWEQAQGWLGVNKPKLGTLGIGPVANQAYEPDPVLSRVGALDGTTTDDPIDQGSPAVPGPFDAIP